MQNVFFFLLVTFININRVNTEQLINGKHTLIVIFELSLLSFSIVTASLPSYSHTTASSKDQNSPQGEIAKAL